MCVLEGKVWTRTMWSQGKDFAITLDTMIYVCLSSQGIMSTTCNNQAIKITYTYPWMVKSNFRNQVLYLQKESITLTRQCDSSHAKASHTHTHTHLGSIDRGSFLLSFTRSLFQYAESPACDRSSQVSLLIITFLSYKLNQLINSTRKIK